MGRFLATCPDPQFRDPAMALELAKKSVNSAPNQGSYWNDLGVAHYRAGNWQEAIVSLEKAIQLKRTGGTSGYSNLDC